MIIYDAFITNAHLWNPWTTWNDKKFAKKKLAKNIDQNALSLNSMTEIFEKRKGILIFIRFALTPGGKVNEIYKHVKYYILKWIKINKLRKQFEY